MQRIDRVSLPWNDLAGGPRKPRQMQVDGADALGGEDEIALVLVGNDDEVAFACPGSFVVFKASAAEPAIDGVLHRMRVVGIGGLDFRLADDKTRTFLGRNHAEELDFIAKDDVGEVAGRQILQSAKLRNAPATADECEVWTGDLDAPLRAREVNASLVLLPAVTRIERDQPIVAEESPALLSERLQ